MYITPYSIQLHTFSPLFSHRSFIHLCIECFLEFYLLFSPYYASTRFPVFSLLTFTSSSGHSNSKLIVPTSIRTFLLLFHSLILLPLTHTHLDISVVLPSIGCLFSHTNCGMHLYYIDSPYSIPLLSSYSLFFLLSQNNHPLYLFSYCSFYTVDNIRGTNSAIIGYVEKAQTGLELAMEVDLHSIYSS